MNISNPKIPLVLRCCLQSLSLKVKYQYRPPVATERESGRMITCVILTILSRVMMTSNQIMAIYLNMKIQLLSCYVTIATNVPCWAVEIMVMLF